MTERQYAQAGGKQYPLKTAEERTASAARPTATPDAVPTPQPQPSSRSTSVNVPTPHGSRTVLLAMLVSFGTYALAGPAGIAKLTRLQGYLGAKGATGASGASNAGAVDAGLELAAGPGMPSVFAPRAVFGWITLFVMLTILSDFDATSDLAGAFAMLIMFTTLITLGPDALTNLQKITPVGK